MNETDVHVSVVLPVHNREQLVARAIQSVLDQTFTRFELIVVDDASSDSSANVAREFERDPRVRVVELESNRGAGGARNAGAELATGEWLAFQDSDDRWLPDKLERQLAELDRTDDHPVACYCGAIYYSPEQCYFIPGDDTAPRRTGDLSAAVLKSNPMTPQTMLLSRRDFLAAGGFDESLSINEDWDLVVRLAEQVRFVYVDEPLALIYRTDGSVSSDVRRNIESREYMLRTYADRYAHNGEARGHQNYAAGCMCLAIGEPRRAVRHLRSAWGDGPSARVGMKLVESVVRSIGRQRTSSVGGSAERGPAA